MDWIGGGTLGSIRGENSKLQPASPVAPASIARFGKCRSLARGGAADPSRAEPGAFFGFWGPDRSGVVHGASGAWGGGFFSPPHPLQELGTWSHSPHATGVTHPNVDTSCHVRVRASSYTTRAVAGGCSNRGEQGERTPSSHRLVFSMLLLLPGRDRSVPAGSGSGPRSRTRS